MNLAGAIILNDDWRDEVTFYFSFHPETLSMDLRNKHLVPSDYTENGNE